MKALVTTTGQQRTERVFLVGAELREDNGWDVRESLDELAELASTAGGIIAGRGVQRLDRPVAGTFIGTGKAKELAAHCQADGVDTVVFDDELSPAQGRNLEKIFECKILDRTSLILDIFAQRARTREGKLQVELAQLQHLLPRLTRYWTHLSRQKGGIGMRGEGETQLETDRRKVQERIDRIESDLENVRKQRATQRRGRQRNQWPLASIVGYTNAGKSTLLNRLTGAGVVAEDKLFATLDPTTRRVRLPTNQNVLLSDTVGFIRKLPHRLVEAFKATLEEVVEADLLLHVVDVSHPLMKEQMRSVQEVLSEIGAEEKPSLLVFNKVDQIEFPAMKARLEEEHPGGVFISAATGEGIDALMGALGQALRPVRELVSLEVPFTEAAVIARVHEVGQVVEQNYEGPQAKLRAHVPPHFVPEFSRYLRSGDETQ